MPHAGPSTSFVGRNHELGLTDRWETTAEGESQRQRTRLSGTWPDWPIEEPCSHPLASPVGPLGGNSQVRGGERSAWRYASFPKLCESRARSSTSVVLSNASSSDLQPVRRASRFMSARGWPAGKASNSEATCSGLNMTVLLSSLRVRGPRRRWNGFAASWARCARSFAHSLKLASNVMREHGALFMLEEVTEVSDCCPDIAHRSIGKRSELSPRSGGALFQILTKCGIERFCSGIDTGFLPTSWKRPW